jgi:tripartite-type tricarboxylate transporter receptor subunit TctC
MALWAPRGTPKEIIAKIDASVIEALADPAAHQRFIELG